MATLDESIVNLQRFIAYLVASTGALEKSASFFKESTGRFGDLDGELGAEAAGFNDELQELGSALESGSREAEDALSDLARSAAQGESAAAESRQRQEQTAVDAEKEADGTLDQTGEAMAHLTAQGFEALGHALDQEREELEAGRQECEQAFDDLKAAAGASETDGESAWRAAETAFDEAVSDMSEAASAFEGATAQCVQAFESAADEFEQHCGDLAAEVDAIYDALDAAVAQEGQEWDRASGSLVSAATSVAEIGARDRLEQPADVVEEQALGSLEQTCSALGDVLENVQRAAGELAPLADELARCRQVILTVDELLNALAG